MNEPDEFNCAACGRHVIRWCWSISAPAPELCAECIFLPGWYRDERLRRIIDPDYEVPTIQ
jgi:hypothetical protein